MQKQDKRQPTAVRCLEGFEYTPLAVSADCEIWQCKRPGTGIYSFNIIVTPRGIAVVGDIDGLLFGVGANYGLPFLAGDDVSYYIHSKLELQCKETQFDQLAFRFKVVESIENRVAEANGEDTPKCPSLDEVESRFENLVRVLEGRVFESPLFGALHDFILKAKDTEDARAAHELFYENEPLLRVSDTWKYRFEEPTDELISRLYMVNHAAKHILAIKFPEVCANG